ncbi:TonB family C-terminal domain-containing protein [Chryseobacterium polytrichastri]|uniref:TonB family C-terminal domain-containing protein n=2 Tax=Chryseobacterium polytrichastri TaxID=1302687 RepID=A0A1M7GAV4_9FLAO|nr:TonB family C-terminal domain-containing protein [Chryseobacterium polytrichastri]
MIMIKKIFFIISLLSFSLNVFGQKVHSQYFFYPKEQDSYEGGEKQFYKDFHQIIIDKNLKPCENKAEVYYLKVIVKEDGSVKYLKDDSNSEMALKNKCTYDLGLEVLKYMDKWKSAIIEGEKKPAVASFFIVPDDLFDHYKEGYIPQYDAASFESMPDGISKFREEVVRRIDIDGFNWSNGFKLVVNFTVNTEGKIQDVTLEESSGVKEFDNRVIDGIKRIKKKWSPAKVGGVPVNYRFKLPLNFRPM